MQLARRVLIVTIAVFIALPAAAQWDDMWGKRKAEGAVVVRDGAPVYKSKSSMDVKRTFDRGDVVVGFHREMIVITYELFEENGRSMVGWPKKNSAMLESGWMRIDDLMSFVYDCGCEAECIPVKGSFKRAEWNPCFREAASAARLRLPEVSQRRAVEISPAEDEAEDEDADDDDDDDDDSPPRVEPVESRQSSSSASSDEKALTNADILMMAEAELGDGIIIAKIQQAPSEELDVSPEALVSLKRGGVSKAVLDAMITRVGQR